MPTFRLQCLYAFADDRRGTIVDAQRIEASDRSEAIVKAKQACSEPPDMRLVSAYLSVIGGAIFWTISAMPGQDPLTPAQE